MAFVISNCLGVLSDLLYGISLISSLCVLCDIILFCELSNIILLLLQCCHPPYIYVCTHLFYAFSWNHQFSLFSVLSSPLFVLGLAVFYSCSGSCLNCYNTTFLLFLAFKLWRHITFDHVTHSSRPAWCHRFIAFCAMPSYMYLSVLPDGTCLCVSSVILFFIFMIMYLLPVYFPVIPYLGVNIYSLCPGYRHVYVAMLYRNWAFWEIPSCMFSAISSNPCACSLVLSRLCSYQVCI